MDVIYLLIPIALLLLTVAVSAFFWAVRSHQFDDLEGPAHSILFDEQPGDIDYCENNETSIADDAPLLEQKPDE